MCDFIRQPGLQWHTYRVNACYEAHFYCKPVCTFCKKGDILLLQCKVAKGKGEIGMALEVNQLRAGAILRESHERVCREPQTTCPIAEAVDATMAGKGCLTYRYVLLTALVAKLTNPAIDILSLQVDDPSDGAYAPRTLCSEVVYPFQRQILFNAVGGTNSDPLVNKPARYPRLSKDNKARGDGRIVLDLLCDALPTLTDIASLQQTLDYMMSKLFIIAEENRQQRAEVGVTVEGTGFRELYEFLSDLLDQGFGGAALVLATYALFRIHFPAEEGYRIIPHPVNQSGASSRQRSDIDIELNGRPFLGCEAKDKPFTSGDVTRAAETAITSGLQSLLFVSGRHSGVQSPATYFSEPRKAYARRGFAVGVIDIDELMDFVLVTHMEDLDATQTLSAVYDCITEIGGTAETQTWVYSKLRSL